MEQIHTQVLLNGQLAAFLLFVVGSLDDDK